MSQSTQSRVTNFTASPHPQHNQVMPHWAHEGLTPDEAYFETGTGIREHLKVQHARVREDRLKVNQGVICETCEAGEEIQVGKDRAV